MLKKKQVRRKKKQKRKRKRRPRAVSIPSSECKTPSRFTWSKGLTRWIMPSETDRPSGENAESEQIAKELGGKYTRKQLLELMGEDGGPIETEEKSGGVQFFVPEEDDEEALRAQRPGGDGAPAGSPTNEQTDE